MYAPVTKITTIKSIFFFLESRLRLGFQKAPGKIKIFYLGREREEHQQLSHQPVSTYLGATARRKAECQAPGRIRGGAKREQHRRGLGGN